MMKQEQGNEGENTTMKDKEMKGKSRMQIAYNFEMLGKNSDHCESSILIENK